MASDLGGTIKKPKKVLKKMEQRQFDLSNEEENRINIQTAKPDIILNPEPNTQNAESDIILNPESYNEPLSFMMQDMFEEY
jgi:hypothetical protein